MWSIRVAISVGLTTSVAAKPTGSAAPSVVESPVTYELSAKARSFLTGCWQAAHDRWTFRSDGKRGLVVVRDPADADSGSYAERARIPRPVMYDPPNGSFAFAAAGRIHGLLIVFELDHDALEASVFTSHDGKAYAWTGNHMTLTRCAARP